MKARLLTNLLLGAAFACGAQTVQERIMLADTFLTAPAAFTLENPALAGYRLNTGISEITAGFGQVGGTSRQGYFDARTYLRSGRSTIEGHASYRNGFRLNSGIYENANPELLYPYLTADEVGGRLNDEEYSFGGTYNTALADSTWMIGVQAGYRALLECRRRDPRPKNTVGTLDACVGGAKRTGAYWIGVGVSGRKYKQTNEISFISELGESKIYHTIGMGAQYSRFAGASKNSSYSGHEFGAMANFFPVKADGAFASVDYTRFSFDKILTALNRLPLASAVENTVKAEAGWKNKSLTVSGKLSSSLRKGTENIFGDPIGNVYPEIASLTIFSARNIMAGVSAAWALRTDASRWNLALDAEYKSMRQKYLGFATPRTMDISDFDCGLRANWLHAISSALTFHAGVEGCLSAPASSSISGMPDTPSFMEESTLAEYSWLKARKGSFGVNLGLDMAINRTIAVGIRASAGQTYIASYNSRTNYDFSICMIF